MNPRCHALPTGKRVRLNTKIYLIAASVVAALNALEYLGI